MLISEIVNWNNEPAEGFALILNSICPHPDLVTTRQISQTPLHGADWSRASGTCPDQKVSHLDQRRPVLNLS